MKHALLNRQRVQVAAVAASALVLLGAATVPLTPHQPVAIRLDRPYDLPKDVFDLAYFDRYRHDGHLDVPAAQRALERLSDTKPDSLVKAQNLFDEMAWRAFIALNWPAMPDGRPDPGKGFADDTTPKVWEYWKQTSDVFLPYGAKPVPWDNRARPRADSFKAGWLQIPAADQGLQAFSGPLVDQNKRWLHYTALMNHEEFDYVVENTLYNLEGQAAFQRDHQILFPQNDDARHGAIEIKLAWKILTPAEEKSGRFLVRHLPVVPYQPAKNMQAMVVSPKTQQVVPKAHLTGKSNGNEDPKKALRDAGTLQTVGLVGMHIAMRTRSSPQWIWATFEQIDNTQLDPHSASAKHPLPAHPSLRQPDQPLALVGANILPAYNATDANGNPDWDETSPDSLLPVPVIRLVPPPTSTALLNAAMQSLLGNKNSVLRFYELIGTQWPTRPKAPAVPGGQGSAPASITRKMPGQMVPVYLVNSTMETYFQKGYQTAGALEQDDRVQGLDIDTTPVFGTESCSGCHYSAGACIEFRRYANGKLQRDTQGRKIPIFGENGNNGLTGSANFSWALQIEAQSTDTLLKTFKRR